MDSRCQRFRQILRALGLGIVITLQVAYAQPDSSFTIVVLPDTQFYAASMNGGTPEMFESQTRWVVENREGLNIVFVTHLGDCVQNGDEQVAEWEVADAAFSLLDDPGTSSLSGGIPFGIAVGNHDQSPGGDPDGTTDYYNQFFGESRFRGRAYYGGHYGLVNDNHYQLFSAGPHDFIAIHLEYDTSPDEAILHWADDLLKTHSDRQAIVITHFLMGYGQRPPGYSAEELGPGSFGTQGQAIYDALKDNPNLFLMLGGHVGGRGGEGRREDTYDGNRVYSLLSDYQSRENGGNGLLRIMRFFPDRGEIAVSTFSPYADDGRGTYERDEDSEFVLEYSPGG